MGALGSRFSRAARRVVNQAAPLVRKVAPIAAIAAGGYFLGPALAARVASSALPALLARRGGGGDAAPIVVDQSAPMQPMYLPAPMAPMQSSFAPSGGGGADYSGDEAAPPASPRSFERYLPWIAGAGVGLLGALALSRRR